MFGDDEDIRSDRDLADDFRRGIEAQDRLIAMMKAGIAASIIPMSNWRIFLTVIFQQLSVIF
jgi:hypothetical protein